MHMRVSLDTLEFFVTLILPLLSTIKITDATKLIPSPSVYVSVWVPGPVPAKWKHDYSFPDFVSKDEAFPSLSKQSVTSHWQKSPCVGSYQSTAPSLLMAVSLSVLSEMFPACSARSMGSVSKQKADRRRHRPPLFLLLQAAGGLLNLRIQRYLKWYLRSW